jgi:hypothetical protein
MTLPTTTGPLWQPLTDLRTLLSTLSSVQTFLEADSSTEALAGIYLYETDNDEDTQRPRFLVAVPSDPLVFTRDTVGQGIGAFNWRKSAGFGITQEVQAFNQDAVTEFMATAGSIITDLAGAADSRHIREIRQRAFSENMQLRWKHGERIGYQIYFDVVYET